MLLRPLNRSLWHPQRSGFRNSPSTTSNLHKRFHHLRSVNPQNCLFRIPQDQHNRLFTTSYTVNSPIPSPKPPSFPTIPTCPSSTCVCAPTPAMPPGLEIDHSKPLNGTMAAYAEQVLICTGKEDWMSRIEEENSGDNLANDVKELVGRGGKYADPYHNIVLTNTSLPPSPHPTNPSLLNTSAFLLPSFKYIPLLPRVSFAAVESLVKGYLLPETLHPAHDKISPIHRDRLLRSEVAKQGLWGVRDVEDVLVLICGHGGRDARCGIYGPLLKGEFEEKLTGAGVDVLKGPVDVNTSTENQQMLSAGKGDEGVEQKIGARVATISHIGGHKFAGNVIVYIPPNMRMKDGRENELAGMGIWYGRVEPKHVEGIVKETVLGGRVVEELFRGGVRKGEVLRL